MLVDIILWPSIVTSDKTCHGLVACAFDNKAIQLLLAINQLIERAVTNNAIQSTGTVVLPACTRLLFPLLHAEKIRTFSACNKGNTRRLRATGAPNDCFL